MKPKLCECGCGLPAPIATRTDPRRGHVKGQPLRFITGHRARTQFPSLAKRFLSRVNKDGPMPDARAVAVWPEIAGERCWIYGKNAARRGELRLHGRRRTAPAVAWFLATGKWPEPYALHKCDRPGCVRFSHLFTGTQKRNIADMLAKGRDAMISARGAASQNLHGSGFARSGATERRGSGTRGSTGRRGCCATSPSAKAFRRESSG